MISLFTKSKKKERTFRKKGAPRRLTTLQFQLIVGFVLAIVIALILTGIYYGTRIESLQIERTVVVGGQTIPHSVIENIVNTALAGTYMRLVPKRFIPFYPKNKIIEAIREEDRIKNVHVEITKDQTVTIVFDEYIPYALWCEMKDSEVCLFIDATGFAFAQAPELQGSAFVRYTQEGLMPTIDTNSFDSEFIDETEKFIDQLNEELSLYVTHVTKIGTYDIEYTISPGGIIKVSQTIPMEESFKNLQTILNSEEFAHIEPGSFQYIDLRFGDKIFVNEALPNATTSSTTATTSNPL